MEHESVALLSQYIRIDTSNPPGNEAEAAQFFAKIFDREGIAYKTYEPEPNRVSIRAVIPGTGEKGPVILLNHMDVVPAQPEEWSVNPFGGEVKDGFIHGRGTLDMKGQGIMELVSFLDIKRKEQRPCRDLIFLAVADEETGGSAGVKYLLENHYEDFQAEVVFNEGGYGVADLVPSRPFMMVSPAEKGVCWLRLTRKGPPGHGSMPHGENALEKMVHALENLLVDERPAIITPITAEYFRQLGKGLDVLGPFVEDGKDETLKELLTKSGLMAMPQISAMVKNTISLNRLNAGYKINVIPSQAEAELDIRLLPGQRVDEIIESVKSKLGDSDIDVRVIMSTEASESPREHRYFSRIQEVLENNFPKSIIAPFLLFGTSDSRFFRMKGIPAYGVCPALISMADLKTVHGNDEKISVENMVKGSEVYTALVRSFCEV